MRILPYALVCLWVSSTASSPNSAAAIVHNNGDDSTTSPSTTGTTAAATTAAAATTTTTITNVTKLDCGMRKLALEYARTIQPWRQTNDPLFHLVHDALRLTDLCGVASPSPATNMETAEEKDEQPVTTRTYRGNNYVSGVDHSSLVSEHNEESSPLPYPFADSAKEKNAMQEGRHRNRYQRSLTEDGDFSPQQQQLLDTCHPNNNATTTTMAKSTGKCFFVITPSLSSTSSGNNEDSMCPQNGSLQYPFDSIHKALQAIRTEHQINKKPGRIRQPISPNSSTTSRNKIILRSGIHQLRSTISLREIDSNLEIIGFPKEEVWISGGMLIPQNHNHNDHDDDDHNKNHQWKPWTTNPHIWVRNISDLLQNYNSSSTTTTTTSIPKVASVFSSLSTKPSTKPSQSHHPHHHRYIRARYPNSNPEVDQWGYDSPHKLNYSIPSSDDIVIEWTRPKPGAPPTFEYIDFSHSNPGVPLKNDSSMDGYNLYASGKGGVCSDLWGIDADSYWCSNASAGGWAEVDQECAIQGHLQIPAGITYNTTARQHDPNNDIIQHLTAYLQQNVNVGSGIIHAWHSQSWSMHMFEIDKKFQNVSQQFGGFVFRKGGGRQGGRNWCRCDQCTYAGPWCKQHTDSHALDDRLIGGTWMIENVLVELDQPGEFFFDKTSKMLYVYPNTTKSIEQGTVDPPNLRFGMLETILDIRYATNVIVDNIGFRDTVPTYMSGNWSPPSGGDWSLHRGGAIFLENVSLVTIRNSIFRRLDGTAIFLSRRTRHVVIERNMFEWLGENAVATWGDTHGYDATNEDQPIGTVIQDNVMRELGIFQKQSSAFGQSKASLSVVRNNIMFNMPRAAINFNDMMGGGDIVEKNLIFNTCRESGDHGAINTWDRQPFLTTSRDRTTKSFDPIPRNISNNFIIANYGASQAVDNDDGSSWYHVFNNVFYCSEGFKMDYGGHDSVFEGNLVMAYPYDYQQCVHFGSFAPGKEHIVRGNQCIVGLGDHKPIIGQQEQHERHHYYYDNNDALPQNIKQDMNHDLVVTLDQCKEKHSQHLSKNDYYTPSGKALFICRDAGNDTPESLDEMQSKYGLEIGSTSNSIPKEDVMIQWAKTKLIHPQ